MNKKIYSTLLSTLFSTSLLSYSSLTAAEDLLDAYSMAILSDPALQSAYATRMATREAFPTALAGFLPSIQGVGQLNSSDSDLQALFGNESFPGSIFPDQLIDRNQQVLATASIPIFDLSLWHTLKQSKQTVSLADAIYMANEQDLIIRTSNAYFNLLEAIDNLVFVQAEKKAVGRQLEQTQQKYDVGLVAITDLKDLQAQYDAKIAEEIAANNYVGNSRQELKIITGEFIEEVDGLKQLPLNNPEPLNPDEWVSMAEQYNPFLQAAKYQSDTLESAVKIAKDQHLPTFEFNGGYGGIRGGTLSSPDGDWEQQWSTTVQGNINIFSGGAIASSVRRAQYQHQASLEDFELIRRDTETATRNAFRNVISAMGQVNAFTRAVESANASLEAGTAGFDVGTRTGVELLISISNLYEQERNLARSRYDYILAILQLKQAAGTLNTQDVYLINNWLGKGRIQATEIIESVPGDSGTTTDLNIDNYMGIVNKNRAR